MDSPVPLMHRDPDRSWITDPDPDHTLGKSIWYCFNFSHELSAKHNVWSLPLEKNNNNHRCFNYVHVMLAGQPTWEKKAPARPNASLVLGYRTSFLLCPGRVRFICNKKNSDLWYNCLFSYHLVSDWSEAAFMLLLVVHVFRRWPL